MARRVAARRAVLAALGAGLVGVAGAARQRRRPPGPVPASESPTAVLPRLPASVRLPEAMPAAPTTNASATPPETALATPPPNVSPTPPEVVPDASAGNGSASSPPPPAPAAAAVPVASPVVWRPAGERGPAAPNRSSRATRACRSPQTAPAASPRGTLAPPAGGPPLATPALGPPAPPPPPPPPRAAPPRRRAWTAVAALVVACALGGLGAGLAVAFGGGEEPGAGTDPGPQGVVDTVGAYRRAVAADDGARLCRLLTARGQGALLVEAHAPARGAGCARAATRVYRRPAHSGRTGAPVTTADVSVDGDRAIARPPGGGRVGLRRVGGRWLLDDPPPR